MFEKKFPWTHVSVSFVIGVTAGAITALLLAPMPGRKMQKRVAALVEDQVDNVEKLIRKVAIA